MTISAQVRRGAIRVPIGAHRPGANATRPWSDTGFGYGFIQNSGQSYGATIHRRYTVIIAGKDVTLRADAKKCAAVPATGEVCEELNGLVPKHQEELNQLGATLQQSMQ